MSEQKWPDKIILIRHGESVRNLMKEQPKSDANRYVWADGLRDQDTPLTDTGLGQALTLGVHLAKTEPALNAVFVSPYRRTRQTAERILKGFLGHTSRGGPQGISADAVRDKDMPRLIVEERVREIEFGVLDGLTHEGIQAKYPEELVRREKEGKYWYRPPGGESRPDVALRIHSFLGTLTRDYREQTVAVVAHSVVVLCFRRLLERWGEEEYLQVDREEDVKNCSLTSYVFRDHRMVLEAYNRIC
ncbi:MAG: histidine phosphatase family protein [Candidatus Acidiferrum sp.]